MLHEKVSVLSLGRDYTVVVSGDGGADPQSSLLESSTSGLVDPGHSNSWEPSPHILTAADLKLSASQTGGPSAAGLGHSTSQTGAPPDTYTDPEGRPLNDDANPSRISARPTLSSHTDGGPQHGSKGGPQGGLQQLGSSVGLKGPPYPPVAESPQGEPGGPVGTAPGGPIVAPSPSVSIWTERSNGEGP
ncbi:regulator of chromosome condensation domain-containing protein, putative [Eimeria brunetti]|uniref:Regulator of chromosome condensation domain-containing protein, putative n=1 Tax=Eimeria brunetti TaxID=51314 RepID=U6LJH9_9EIME|nr:regulator of chromosome condensation domain-containing protein, putative [Eimeria brunetti]